MFTKIKLLRIIVMLSAGLFLTLAAAPASVERTQALHSTTVTKFRVHGLSAHVFVFDDTGAGGFVSFTRDQLANTTGLDFSYAVPHPTDPDLVIVFQGAGEIPNTGVTISSTSAHLALTTPDSYPTYRCVVNINTTEYTCALYGPLTFDLTWVANGFGSRWEKGKWIETFGPVTTKFDGEFTSRTASVNGSFGEFSGTNMTGTLYDTQNKTFIREVTLKSNP